MCFRRTIRGLLNAWGATVQAFESHTILFIIKSDSCQKQTTAEKRTSNLDYAKYT